MDHVPPRQFFPKQLRAERNLNLDLPPFVVPLSMLVLELRNPQAAGGAKPFSFLPFLSNRNRYCDDGETS